MDIELIIATVSVIGAVTSMIAAVSSYRREEAKIRLERDEMAATEAERTAALKNAVAEDTVGLYRRITEQYTELSEKDKKLLKTITFVIRNMLLLDRTVADLLSEMEVRWDEHHNEAEEINCPFYNQMTEYRYQRITGIRAIIAETMSEIDRLLFNGSGPVLTTDKQDEV